MRVHATHEFSSTHGVTIARREGELMIHLLGWAAVVLTAAHSYNTRSHLDPHGVLEHRAGLPALGYAAAMLLSLTVLVSLTGAG